MNRKFLALVQFLVIGPILTYSPNSQVRSPFEKQATLPKIGLDPPNSSKGRLQRQTMEIRSRFSGAGKWISIAQKCGNKNGLELKRRYEQEFVKRRYEPMIGIAKAAFQSGLSLVRLDKIPTATCRQSQYVTGTLENFQVHFNRAMVTRDSYPY